MVVKVRTTLLVLVICIVGLVFRFWPTVTATGNMDSLTGSASTIVKKKILLETRERADEEEVKFSQAPPVPSLYGNLSCPFEWSKYSCIHQENSRGNLSYSLAEKAWTELFSKYKAAIPFALQKQKHFQKPLQPYRTNANKTKSNRSPSSPSRVFLIGDSTTRQVFISLGCLFWQLDQIESYNIPWLLNWPCHNTPHCVSGGIHSGFPVGQFRLQENSNIEFWFIPIGGSLGRQKLYVNILEKWINQWNQTKQLTMTVPPDLRNNAINGLANHTTSFEQQELKLNPSDIIVYNIGLHVEPEERAKKLNKLNQLGQFLLQQPQQESAVDEQKTIYRQRPTLAYWTTVSQHFPTKTGQYATNMTKFKRCNASVPYPNLRKAVELTQLQEGHNVNIVIDTTDEDFGNHHIGVGDRADCTHYCQPGVPDLTAHMFLKKLFKL